MSHEKLLPMKNPGTEAQLFLEGWKVDPNGIYLPPSDGEDAVFLWHGAFHRGETITLLASEGTNISYAEGTLYVGIVTKDAVQAAVDQGRDKLDAHVDAAVALATGGIFAAVETLKILGALPVSH